MSRITGSIGRRLGVVLAGVVLLAGCESPLETRALLAAAQTAAALEVEQELPTLPWFTARVAHRGGEWDALARTALQEAAARWDDALAPERAAPLLEVRESAYDLALPLLIPRVTPSDLDAARTALDSWLSAASEIVAGAPLEEVAAVVARGRALAELARASAEQGEWETAVRTSLYAADVLIEATPRFIALRLTAAGEQSVAGRRGPDGAGGSIALDRADRLLRGAREALAEGDHTLAIRRAYYARQLVGQ